MLPTGHRQQQQDGPPLMAAQQTGIDILCDAAGSDLASASFESEPHQLEGRPLVKRARTGTASESAPGPDYHYRQRQSTGSPHPSAATPSISHSASSQHTPPSHATPTHVCPLCKRVYERADHLTRHLRSHENARPYQCSRCPKRFNRAYVAPFFSVYTPPYLPRPTDGEPIVAISSPAMSRPMTGRTKEPVVP